MMRRISEIVPELQRIPGAVWDGDNPPRPPTPTARAFSEVKPSSFSPVFDDGNFEIPDSSVWDERVGSVSHRVAWNGSDADGSTPVGIDALAWYVSFHSRRDDWGIYIPLSSLPLLDSTPLSGLDLPRADRWRLAWDILATHEIVHFAVDYACAWFELLFHAPIRRALRDRIRHGLDKSLFPEQAGYLEVEETLANGHVLRKLADGKSETARAIRRFIRAQPPGYRDGERAESDKGFHETAAEVLRSYLTVWSSGFNIDPGNPALDLTRLIPLGREAQAACPIWVVNDLQASGLPPDAVRIIDAIPQIHETPAFAKQLARLDPNDQKAWQRTKSRLCKSKPNGSDFKKWRPAAMWSVRVTGGIRAHLQQPSAGDPTRQWCACAIGSHTAMGHD